MASLCSGTKFDIEYTVFRQSDVSTSLVAGSLTGTYDVAVIAYSTSSPYAQSRVIEFAGLTPSGQDIRLTLNSLTDASVNGHRVYCKLSSDPDWTNSLVATVGTGTWGSGGTYDISAVGSSQCRDLFGLPAGVGKEMPGDLDKGVGVVHVSKIENAGGATDGTIEDLFDDWVNGTHSSLPTGVVAANDCIPTMMCNLFGFVWSAYIDNYSQTSRVNLTCDKPMVMFLGSYDGDYQRIRASDGNSTIDFRDGIVTGFAGKNQIAFYDNVTARNLMHPLAIRTFGSYTRKGGTEARVIYGSGTDIERILCAADFYSGRSFPDAYVICGTLSPGAYDTLSRFFVFPSVTPNNVGPMFWNTVYDGVRYKDGACFSPSHHIAVGGSQNNKNLNVDRFLFFDDSGTLQDEPTMRWVNKNTGNRVRLRTYVNVLITDSNGDAIQGATVTLYDGVSQVFQTTTDANGELASDETVIVKQIGYSTSETADFEILVTSSGKEPVRTPVDIKPNERFVFSASMNPVSTAVYPDPASVWELEPVYGPGGDDYAGTLVVASADDTRADVQHGPGGDGVIGNVVIPAASDLRRDVGAGTDGEEVIGTIDLTTPDNIRAGVGIGADGEEVIGTYEPYVSDADIRVAIDAGAQKLAIVDDSVVVSAGGAPERTSIVAEAVHVAVADDPIIVTVCEEAE